MLEYERLTTDEEEAEIKLYARLIAWEEEWDTGNIWTMDFEGRDANMPEDLKAYKAILKARREAASE